MSKITILSDIKRDNSFVEKLPNINYKEFDKVIKSRRSVRVFTKEKIPKSVIKKSLDNSLKAPTSSNLQTWEIYWARSNNIKDKIIRACLSQPAAKTAKELFVFVSRPDNWKRNNQMMIDHLKTKENDANVFLGNSERIPYSIKKKELNYHGKESSVQLLSLIYEGLKSKK